MACSIKKGGFYSPESTITSLLASCNLDSNNSCSSSSIHYKEKLYNSASQALEAYIEDFDLSLVSPEVSTGKISIGQSTPKCIKSSERCSKQKYGLEDLNQHVKLDSNASSFRRQRFCDLDLVSLTTDDLLAFPPDGSLPSIQSTPFGLELQSSERKKKSLGKSRFCPYYGMSSSKIERDFEDNGSTDDQLELLILKARRTLESSAGDLPSIMKNDGSPCTVDLLEAERSWENVPIAFKPPVPVQCEEEENALRSPKANIVNEFLEDCLNNADQENTFSGGNHHGPVEALKLMLFNLQAVQESFKQTETTERKEELIKLSEEEVSELKLNDNEVIPVTRSLQKALHHLSRLKSLVDDNSKKEDQDDDHQGDKKKEN